VKCAKCPLFTSWNNESDRGESCGLFGDSWDNVLQYEDKEGKFKVGYNRYGDSRHYEDYTPVVVPAERSDTDA